MHSLYIDLKYVGIISVRLRNFLNKGNHVSSFSHVCERNNSNKRRGYFLPYKGSILFKCHHCGQSTSLGNFINGMDPGLYSEYRMEIFKESAAPSPKISNEEKEVFDSNPLITEVGPGTLDLFKGLINFSTIAPSNPARRYLERRQIPSDKIDLFYLVHKFYSWASQIDPVFEKFQVEAPRLILPNYGENKELLGFSCRAFGKEIPKYIQLRLDKGKEFVYGTDRIDKSKPIIAVEGQIDSLFLDNAIAVGNANYSSNYLRCNSANVIIVPDNDFRRNPVVCGQLKKAIQNGFCVSILPDKWHKDVNDIIKKDNVTRQELMTYILSNRKSGIAALLELTLEKRC